MAEDMGRWTGWSSKVLCTYYVQGSWVQNPNKTNIENRDYYSVLNKHAFHWTNGTKAWPCGYLWFRSMSSLILSFCSSIRLLFSRSSCFSLSFSWTQIHNKQVSVLKVPLPPHSLLPGCSVVWQPPRVLLPCLPCMTNYLQTIRQNNFNLWVALWTHFETNTKTYFLKFNC